MSYPVPSQDQITNLVHSGHASNIQTTCTHMHPKQSETESIPASPVIEEDRGFPNNMTYLFENPGIFSVTEADHPGNAAPSDGGEEYCWRCCECAFAGNTKRDEGCSNCHNHWRCYYCKIEYLKPAPKPSK